MHDAAVPPASRKKEGLPLSALLLAGGKGSRMGGNKLFLSDGEAPLIEGILLRLSLLFEEVVLCIPPQQSSRVQELFAPLLESYRVVLAEDKSTERGPLEGLRTGLSAMRCDWGFLFGCDMPYPQEAVIRQMWALTPNDAHVSVIRLEGHLMAFHAFYKKECLPAVEQALARAQQGAKRGGRIVSFYDAIRLHVLEESALAPLPHYRKSFNDCNTPNEFHNALNPNLFMR